MELTRLLQTADGAGDVIIDCSRLDYSDSTGLTQLFKLHQAMEGNGGSIFALTRLDAVFKFRD